jgi:hypothetical protein
MADDKYDYGVLKRGMWCLVKKDLSATKKRCGVNKAMKRHAGSDIPLKISQLSMSGQTVRLDTHWYHIDDITVLDILPEKGQMVGSQYLYEDLENRVTQEFEDVVAIEPFVPENEVPSNVPYGARVTMTWRRDMDGNLTPVYRYHGDTTNRNAEGT